MVIDRELIATGVLPACVLLLVSDMMLRKLLLAGFLGVASLARAEDDHLPTLRVGAQTYTNVIVISATATDLYFSHSRGFGNAKLKDCEPGLQAHFRFDPEKAATKQIQQVKENALYAQALRDAPPPKRPVELPDIVLPPILKNGIGSKLEIVGSEQFTNRFHQALALLEARDPEAYTLVTNYIGRIREGKHNGMWASRTPPTYEVGASTATASVTWCAGGIAHESIHSKLYHDYKNTHDGPVPGTIWKGTEAEKICMQQQVAVLQHIGAPRFEVDYARTQADGHYVKASSPDGIQTWDEYLKNDF